MKTPDLSIIVPDMMIKIIYVKNIMNHILGIVKIVMKIYVLYVKKNIIIMKYLI